MVNFIKMKKRGEYGKRAASDWTVGKLMAIVLAIIILAIVIYGISTGGINPLVNKIKGMGQEVMARLRFWDEGSGDDSDCVYRKDILVFDDIRGYMTLCSYECKVDLDVSIGSYRFNFETGHLEKYIKNKWRDVEYMVDSSVPQESKNFQTKMKDWLWNNCQ